MKRVVLSVILLLASASLLRAQRIAPDTLHTYGIYDTDRLSPKFHAGRRDSLLAQMGAHSVALILAAPEQNRSNDVNYLYHQNPNFYYLTGLLEPDAALILSKDPIQISKGHSTHAILFLQERDPSKETWTGKRLGPLGAKQVLGFSDAYVIDSLSAYLKPLLAKSDTLLYTPGERTFSSPLLDTSMMLWDSVRRELNTKYPKLTIAASDVNGKQVSNRLIHELALMRSIKTPEELVMMRRAIAISNLAHNEIMSHVRPGWHEYEIQALGEYIFTKNGAEYTGYPSIIGSGENSTILHYETNRRETVSGDFVEMDMGAEYHGYSADITRSYPVNGRFTPEQRAIYDLVLEAQDSGIAAAKAGAPFFGPHMAAASVIKAGLVRLGILKDSADYRKYFMHGTSHYLGLDVHDAGTYTPLQAGNVITVEPGIYIKAGSDCDKKWWNIGCRIEDDILIKKDGPEILSVNSPRKADDVEKLMHSGR
jgi:Xaa-Pro aminopeptidase